MALYHTAQGSATYSASGSPTIVDGVVSGFSDSNTLVIYPAFTPNYNSFELVLKIKTGDDVATEQKIFTSQYGANNENRFGFVIGINNGKITHQSTVDGTSWANETSGTTTISANTDYFIKCKRSGSTINYYLSTNGATWSNEISTSFSSPNVNFIITYIGNFYSYVVGEDFAFLGSLDLKGTYIKTNGAAWFGKCPVEVKKVMRGTTEADYVIREDKTTHVQKMVYANPKMYLTGPNNYTVVGSPTITDGVATNLLNRTNSIRIPAFPDVVSSFEMVLKSKGSGQNRVILFNSYTGPSVFYKAKTQISRTSAAVSKWVFKPCSNSTEEAEYSVSANGGIPYTPNEWVYVKHSMVSNGDDTYTYTLSYSLDGTTYTDVASKTSSYRISGTDWGGLLICSDQNYSAGDSITINGLDLKESYIKIDGSLWFYGKNYATQNIAPVPSGYTYGTTTTSAIGWVDMRTQAFTAAPSGATLGKDS